MPPKTVTVPPTDIIRIKASVDGDDSALITLSYVNQKVADENYVLDPRPKIAKRMFFDEVCLHSLIFAVVGDHEKQGTLKVTLENTRMGDEVVYDSGAIAVENGAITHQIWVSPA